MYTKLHSDQKGSKSAILQALRLHGAVSRVHLASITGLSRAAVSTAISDLLELKLVRETEVLQSTGGRPATALELAPSSHAIIGADYTNQGWTVGAFDLLGNVIHSTKISVDAASAETAISRLAEEIRDLISNIDITVLSVLGLGMPGLIDSKTGVVQSAADLGWSNVAIGQMMNDRIGWPTVVLNRHKARGLAESRFGSGRNWNEMIYVGVGSGIAAGLFYNQHLIPGSMGGAGELGHITIDPGGPLCLCGNNGCLQLLAAGPAMEQEFRKHLRAGAGSQLFTNKSIDLQLLKAEEICAAADRGDEAALTAVNKAATYLGISLATIVNLFNPQGIVLGGPIPKAGSIYVQTAEKIMRQRAMSPLTAKTEVRTATISDLGGALGAANYALDKHLSLHLLTSGKISI
jgi:predicted NBD/HSP70 family sugar kinase